MRGLIILSRDVRMSLIPASMDLSDIRDTSITPNLSHWYQYILAPRKSMITPYWIGEKRSSTFNGLVAFLTEVDTWTAGCWALSHSPLKGLAKFSLLLYARLRWVTVTMRTLERR